MSQGAVSLAEYRPDLADVLAAAKAPAYRGRQVYRHLTHHPGEPFAEATSLPLGLRAALDEAGHSLVRVAERRDDPDGTTKLLLEARDGARLETVIMRYARGTTLCVSSQIGCPLACTFCATGAMGFVRNLTAGEIVDQVLVAAALLIPEERRPDNVVFMGMGEPLLNLDAVLGSLRVLHDEEGVNMARRSLSVSTVGIPAGILRLAREEPQVNLALSLHAPDEELRNSLIPAGRRYPLSEVLAAAAEHFRLTHRKLFVEYLLLGGVNDEPRMAAALARLLEGRTATVNLIPWNPACGDYRPSSAEAQERFRRVLEERGLSVTVRQSRGWSIAAACGQLTTESARSRPAAGDQRGGREGRSKGD